MIIPKGTFLIYELLIGSVTVSILNTSFSVIIVIVPMGKNESL